MLKKLALATALVATTALPFTAQAEMSQSERTIKEVYTQCGLGGLIFGDTSEVLAIISNVTWDWGTTAAISDSASPETCNGGAVKAAVLINEAFPSVEKDLAAGTGAHLTALADVAGCSSTKALRNSYGAYAQTDAYATATKEQNSEALYSIVGQTCSL